MATNHATLVDRVIVGQRGLNLALDATRKHSRNGDVVRACARLSHQLGRAGNFGVTLTPCVDELIRTVEPEFSDVTTMVFTLRFLVGLCRGWAGCHTKVAEHVSRITTAAANHASSPDVAEYTVEMLSSLAVTSACETRVVNVINGVIPRVLERHGHSPVLVQHTVDLMQVPFSVLVSRAPRCQ
jgi:hypothetical protein